MPMRTFPCKLAIYIGHLIVININFYVNGETLCCFRLVYSGNSYYSSTDVFEVPILLTFLTKYCNECNRMSNCSLLMTLFVSRCCIDFKQLNHFPFFVVLPGFNVIPVFGLWKRNNCGNQTCLLLNLHSLNCSRYVLPCHLSQVIKYV